MYVDYVWGVELSHFLLLNSFYLEKLVSFVFFQAYPVVEININYCIFVVVNKIALRIKRNIVTEFVYSSHVETSRIFQISSKAVIYYIAQIYHPLKNEDCSLFFKNSVYR